MSLTRFRKTIETDDRVARLRAGLIGDGMLIPGLTRQVPLVYADHVASGRALAQVEDFIRSDVLPYYANSHTEASFCGAFMTGLRDAARQEIARLTGAGPDHSVIFTGSGATSGLNRLVKLFGVDTARSAVVFVGPYEHHSNLLPWRESRATVIQIPEGSEGGPDLEVLRARLIEHADAEVKIGSFSAASNVTGIITPPAPVTRLLRAHGALAVWDFAGAGPYLDIDVAPEPGAEMDAAVISVHKFPGGPGASGVLILRDASVVIDRPTSPGGGTVSFVSPWAHSYSDSLSAREEAGTPNMIGDIRAALAFIVKDVLGSTFIERREQELNAMTLAAWQDHPQLTLLGAGHTNRLPIFSFLVRRRDGTPFHHQLFTRMLSDVHGIQARGGCACAGPYAHALLDIDQAASGRLFAQLGQGHELTKPGWVRLNFSYLMSDAQARCVIDGVLDLLDRLEEVENLYSVDTATARFALKPDRREIANGVSALS